MFKVFNMGTENIFSVFLP